MPVEFKDEPGRSHHDDFQRWRRKNPHGYFLAFRTATAAVLHRTSGCWHPGNSEWRSKDTQGHSLTRKLKVCARTASELHAYAKTGGIEVAECAHCRPEYGRVKSSTSSTGSSRVNHEQRAARVWTALVACAGSKKTVTYGELARSAGGFHYRALRFPLGLIQDYCLEAKLHPLTSLVVHGGDSLPGTGFVAWDADDVETAQHLVFNFDWSNIANPFGYALGGETEERLAERLLEEPPSAGEIYQLVKVRGVAQSVFRLALLDAYDYACAFCGLSFTEALDAAHIVPWAKCNGSDRMSVNNGLLLCSNHHEMFDADWLRVSEDFKIHYTDMPRQHGPYSSVDEILSVKLNGKNMTLPERKKLWPDPDKIRQRYRK